MNKNYHTIELLYYLFGDSKEVQKNLKIFELKCESKINCLDVSAANEELVDLLYNKKIISGKGAKECINEVLETMRMSESKLFKDWTETGL